MTDFRRANPFDCEAVCRYSLVLNENEFECPECEDWVTAAQWQNHMRQHEQTEAWESCFRGIEDSRSCASDSQIFHLEAMVSGLLRRVAALEATVRSWTPRSDR